jgi:hypothetical protein
MNVTVAQTLCRAASIASQIRRKAGLTVDPWQDLIAAARRISAGVYEWH